MVKHPLDKGKFQVRFLAAKLRRNSVSVDETHGDEWEIQVRGCVARAPLDDSRLTGPITDKRFCYFPQPPEEDMDPLFTREELQKIRDRARSSSVEATNPNWKAALDALAMAADRLDALWARAEVVS